MLVFYKRYFSIAILLLIIEVSIAVFFHDRFVRGWLGDFLVVIMLYYFVRAFLNINRHTIAVSVLAFAYFVEITQYFHLIDHLDWQRSIIARTVLGSSFAWSDMLAYTVGIVAALFTERI